MKVPFVGRDQELRALREPNWRGRALLAVVYGRRRVGKTALVEEAFRDDTLWKFEGIEAGDTRTQLGLFMKQLSRYTGSEDAGTVTGWEEAFRALERATSRHTKRNSGRLVVFFDEFQWLCEMKPKLVALFKYHWDNAFAKHAQCVFVLCGSVSSFIVKKVVQSRALYGRVDLEINLPPLPFRESRVFFKDTPYAEQSLEAYMVFGCVPQYLTELNPRLSLQQNMNEYAFRPSAFFFREFDRLFFSHFARHPTYERT